MEFFVLKHHEEDGIQDLTDDAQQEIEIEEVSNLVELQKILLDLELTKVIISVYVPLDIL